MTKENQIRKLLEERKETMAQAAVGAGITESTLRRAADGKPTHRSTRRLICQYFGLTENLIWVSSDS